MSERTFTPDQTATFLEALGEQGTVAHACRAILCSRKTYYRERERVPEFAARCDEAIERGRKKIPTLIRQTLLDRMLNGVEIPTYGRRRKGAPAYAERPITGYKLVPAHHTLQLRVAAAHCEEYRSNAINLEALKTELRTEILATVRAAADDEMVAKVVAAIRAKGDDPNEDNVRAEIEARRRLKAVAP